MSSTNGTGPPYLYTRSSYTSSGPSSSPGGLSRLRRYGEETDSKTSGPSSLTSYTSKYSSSYSTRLSGLDRLAQRQKAFEQANGIENKETNGTTLLVSSPTSSTTPPSSGPLATKRELFFKGESGAPNPPANAPSSTIGQNGPPTSDKPIMNHAPTSAANHTPPVVPPPPVTTNPAATRDNKLDYLRKESVDNEKDKVRDKLKENGVTPQGAVVSNIIRPRRPKEVDATVGFDNLPNQVYRKAVKKGFEFTLMVVGESGLGKSTLINSMFLADIYSAEHPGPSRRIKKTIQVETTKALLKENAVNLTLTVVDTPGFGDAVDNSNCWQPVMEYIESKYEEYLNAESRVNRKPGLADGRVHACLYFIAPSGHGLKPLDVEFMRRLHDKVNIIPVIAKADTMTPDECQIFKKQIINEIAQHKIKIYEFPDGDDEEENKAQKAIRDKVPFAVVGSNCILELDGKKVRGRRYPWGVVEVENLSHCDFIALRNMVIRTHMQDLKEVTNSIHYENFRCRKLAGLGQEGKGKLPNKNPLAQMEEERKDHEAKMAKMEAEMQQVFDMKVKEKRQRLKDLEVDIMRRQEQMKKTNEQAEAELEDKKKQFESEVRKWEEANGLTLEELRRKSLESSSKETVDGKTKKKKGLF